MQPDAPPKVARSWLLTVARNHCLDVLRRRKRFGRALVTLGGNPHNGADLESAVVDRDFANVVLSHLSLRERQALWQSAVESRPLADIATRLRLNYMAAAQVLHRARLHAASTAARIAVVIGVARLGHALRRNTDRRNVGDVSESAFRSLVTVDRILALAAVPLIVVAVQSSSSVTPAAAESAQHMAPVSTITAPATASAAGPQLLRPSPTGLGALTNPGASPLSAAGTLPAGATSALNAAVGSVSRSLGQLPVPTPAGSIIPSLPPVSVTLPPLPVPTPSLPPVVP